MVLISAPHTEFNMLKYKPNVVDAQLLLYAFGEEESGTGVSAQAVRHDKDQRAPTGPHETPAGNTHSLISCLVRFLDCSPGYKMTSLCLT